MQVQAFHTQRAWSLSSQPHSDDSIFSSHDVSPVPPGPLLRYEDLSIRAGEADSVESRVIVPGRHAPPLNPQLHTPDVVAGGALLPRAPVPPVSLHPGLHYWNPKMQGQKMRDQGWCKMILKIYIIPAKFQKNPQFPCPLEIRQNIYVFCLHYPPMRQGFQKCILMCTSITYHCILFTWTCKSRAIILPVSCAGAAAGGAGGVRFTSKDNAHEGQKYYN